MRLRCFQSHYGAIATSTKLGSAITMRQLSIPLWCDCNTANRSGAYPIKLFQSHYGAIATTMSAMSSTIERLLSIPLWCDCNRRHTPLPTLFPITFNPTMVRLQPSHRYQPHAPKRLSIPLWCDCNIVGFPPLHNRSILSIPLWCDCNDHRAARRNSVPTLSIPLWCDCNHQLWQLAFEDHPTFNPTMVRLQP